jgi:hypothetical protein
MDATRRDVLAAAVTAAGATATQNFAHAEEHDHQDVPSDVALRVKSLESLLVEKGLVDRAALDALVDTYEHKVGPRNGARVVARAWVDPAYKQRLLADGRAALKEWFLAGRRARTRSWWRIRHGCTISSSVRSALVILGPSLVCLRLGTSPHLIARAP